MLIACSEYRTALTYCPDVRLPLFRLPSPLSASCELTRVPRDLPRQSVDAFIRYGDAVTDFGNLVPGAVLRQAAMKAAENAYAEAKRLAPPPPVSSPSRILKPPPMYDISWSSDDDDRGGGPDDRMDTS
jgi:hypothetical protein